MRSKIEQPNVTKPYSLPKSTAPPVAADHYKKWPVELIGNSIVRSL